MKNTNKRPSLILLNVMVCDLAIVYIKLILHIHWKKFYVVKEWQKNQIFTDAHLKTWTDRQSSKGKNRRFCTDSWFQILTFHYPYIIFHFFKLLIQMTFTYTIKLCHNMSSTSLHYELWWYLNHNMRFTQFVGFMKSPQTIFWSINYTEPKIFQSLCIFFKYALV